MCHHCVRCGVVALVAAANSPVQLTHASVPIPFRLLRVQTLCAVLLLLLLLLLLVVVVVVVGLQGEGGDLLWMDGSQGEDLGLLGLVTPTLRRSLELFLTPTPPNRLSLSCMRAGGPLTPDNPNPTCSVGRV